MSQKQPKPVLTGQRLRSRKRDEKKKFDPGSFRDSIIALLKEADGDLEQASTQLDQGANKLNYREYAEALFDILFSGGLLAPGGTVVEDGAEISPICLFAAPAEQEAIKAYVELFTKLVRRYKYLHKSLEEYARRVMRFQKGFTVENRQKLAMAIGMALGDGLLPPVVLTSLMVDTLQKEDVALSFVTHAFRAWLSYQPAEQVGGQLRKAGLDDRLIEFFPSTRQTTQNLEDHFTNEGLLPLVKFYLKKKSNARKTDLLDRIKEMLRSDVSQAEIATLLQESVKKETISEAEAVSLLWVATMDGVDWNKKPELMADQALRHIKASVKLLGQFTTGGKAELALLNRIQVYCYDNMNFMKLYHRIVLLLYNNDVVSEDTIMTWYRGAHDSKGQGQFLKQMEKMVEWLQNASEEESDEDEEEG